MTSHGPCVRLKARKRWPSLCPKLILRDLNTLLFFFSFFNGRPSRILSGLAICGINSYRGKKSKSFQIDHLTICRNWPAGSVLTNFENSSCSNWSFYQSRVRVQTISPPIASTTCRVWFQRLFFFFIVQKVCTSAPVYCRPNAARSAPAYFISVFFQRNML